MCTERPAVRIRCRTAVCALAVLAAADGWAGEEPRDDYAELQPITVIASKSARPLAEVGATVSLISADTMTHYLNADLRDVLRYEPGVSVAGDPARFGLQSVNIRGLEGNRVAMEIDGSPVAESFAVGSFASAGRDLVDPAILERVEILRGPASTLYGSDALGGVVTFTTRDPDSYLAGGRQGAVDLRAGHDSRDDANFVTMAGARALGPVEVLGVYSRRAGTEVENALGEPPANPEDFRSDSLLGKLVLRGETATSRLTLERHESRSQVDVRSAVGGPGKFSTTTSLLGDDTYRRTRAAFQQEWQLARPWADRLDWRAHYQRSRTLQHSEQERSPDSRMPDATRRLRDFDYVQETSGFELHFEKTLDAGGTQHRLLYGMESDYTRRDEFRDGVEINLADGSSTNVIVGENLPLRDFPVTSTLETGLWVQDEIDLGRLSLIPGLRYQYYDLDSQEDALWLGDNPDTIPADYAYHSLTPQFGARYRFGARWSGMLRYTRGFRAPPAEDVNLGFTIPLFGYMALPNPDLKPETSDGIELGGQLVSPLARLRVSAYYNRYRNLIESRVNLGLDPESGYLIFQSRNRERASIYGLEATADVDLGGFRTRLEGLRVRASLAWSRGTDESTGQPLEGIQPLRVAAGIALQPRGRRWTAGVDVALADGVTRTDESAGPRFLPPGYAVVDLYGSFALSERAVLRLAVLNAGDRTWWNWNEVRGLAPDDPLLGLYTQPGRNLLLSLSLSM